MDNTMNFSFDFKEVLEGIKCGVIKEMAEMNFQEAKELAINQIKEEIKKELFFDWSDREEIKEEIKNEIKGTVIEKIVAELKETHFLQYKEYFKNLTMQEINNAERRAIAEIKSDVTHGIKSQLIEELKYKSEKILENFAIKLDKILSIEENLDSDYVQLSKVEYEKLCKNERKLEALEGYGVDNWDGYDDAIASLDGGNLL